MQRGKLDPLEKANKYRKQSRVLHPIVCPSVTLCIVAKRYIQQQKCLNKSE